MKTPKRKIVFTGIGVVSSIGIGKEAFWNGLCSGKSGIKNVSLFSTDSISAKTAGEIVGFKPEEILGDKGLRNLDRTTKLSLCAAKLTLDDACFIVNEANARRVGVVLGSTMGSVYSISEFDKEALRNGPRSVNPALFPNTVINSPASQISIRFGIKGFNATVSTGFTSAFSAMEYAASFLRNNRADAVLVGGAEELCEQIYKGMFKLGFLSSSKKDGAGEMLAPFDSRRNGTILGEGAAMFLLERYETAVARKAHIYGELIASASAFDGRGMLEYNARGTGLSVAIQQALSESDVGENDIQYVSSSANSTLLGDYAESKVLNNIFGSRKGGIAMSSSKSMLGETFSASGAFQIASGLMTLSLGIAHPTINYSQPDNRCKVDCIPNNSRDISAKNVLVSCISPMGQNSAAIISRREP